MKKTGIIAFIAIFCVLALLPFAANMGSAKEPVEVSYDTPVINALAEHKCIEDTEYMKANHMKLLDQWRWDVVRNGDTKYVADDGTVYDKSLDDTCMACHSNQAEFCDKCHTYEGVNPYCWDCHATWGMWLEDESNAEQWNSYFGEGGF